MQTAGLGKVSGVNRSGIEGQAQGERLGSGTQATAPVSR